ncbi:MAG TPA: NDP-sugar synthase [Thermoanaerobaculia bacterium]|nr:NDP-sugar synthase [Thermoanaerobaculia bacterium]
MKGMILAAGLGTRFRPATFEIPKPLIPFCNRPLIAWVLDAMLAAGVREIAVNLHHLPDPLETFLRERYAGRCDFVFSREERILGTGGGIRRLREVLGRDDLFVLANGDTVQTPPFERLAQTCRRERAVAALLLRHPPPNERFTEVFFDGTRITGFGKGRGEPLMFAGAHAVSRAIFELLPEREVSGITEDVYDPLIGSGGTLAGVVDDGLWFDLGSPARYLDATREVARSMMEGRLPLPAGSRVAGSSIVAEDASVEGEASFTVAGAGAGVAESAVAGASVFWEQARIGPGARVTDSILGRGVRIPAGARVHNALVCRRIAGIDYPEGTVEAGELVAVAARSGAFALEGLS